MFTLLCLCPINSICRASDFRSKSLWFCLLVKRSSPWQLISNIEPNGPCLSPLNQKSYGINNQLLAEKFGPCLSPLNQKSYGINNQLLAEKKCPCLSPLIPKSCGINSQLLAEKISLCLSPKHLCHFQSCYFKEEMWYSVTKHQSKSFLYQVYIYMYSDIMNGLTDERSKRQRGRDMDG